VTEGLEIDESSVTAGEQVTLSGEYWFSECPSVDDEPGGCAGKQPSEGPYGPPDENIALAIKNPRSGRSIMLGTVDAGPDYTFEHSVTVPKLPPGRYLFTANTGEAETRADASALITILERR
jgi:hypothetical protein